MIRRSYYCGPCGKSVGPMSEIAWVQHLEDHARGWTPQPVKPTCTIESAVIVQPDGSRWQIKRVDHSL